MFTPLPMQRVELSLLKDDAAAAALLLARHGAFNPETSAFTAEQLPEQPGEAYRKAHDQGRAHLDKIFAHYELTPPEVDGSGKPVTLDTLAARNGWLDLERIMMEVLTSIRRAGADLVLTYFAKRVARVLNG